MYRSLSENTAAINDWTSRQMDEPLFAAAAYLSSTDSEGNHPYASLLEGAETENTKLPWATWRARLRDIESEVPAEKKAYYDAVMTANIATHWNYPHVGNPNPNMGFFCRTIKNLKPSLNTAQHQQACLMLNNRPLNHHQFRALYYLGLKMTRTFSVWRNEIFARENPSEYLRLLSNPELTAMVAQFQTVTNAAGFHGDLEITKRQFERIFQAVFDVRYPKHAATHWNDQQQLLKVKGDTPSKAKFVKVLNQIRGVTNSVWNTTPITEKEFEKVLKKMKEFKNEDLVGIDGEEIAEEDKPYAHLEEVKFARILWRTKLHPGLAVGAFSNTEE
jgi:hypothetical protein